MTDSTKLMSEEEELEALIRRYAMAHNTAFNEIDPHNHEKHPDDDGMSKVFKRAREIETQILEEAWAWHYEQKKLYADAILNRLKENIPSPQVSEHPNNAQNSYEVGFNDYRWEVLKVIESERQRNGGKQ